MGHENISVSDGRNDESRSTSDPDSGDTAIDKEI